MSSSNATCYYNDGSVANQNYFCGLPNQNTCCGPDWLCLSNGLCRQSSGMEEYAQGSCTDPSFKKCLSFCNYAQPGNFTSVSRCEPAGNSWCFICALQDPNGVSCCDTNLTTSLEPYPFTIRTPIQPTVDSSSVVSIPSLTEPTPTPSSSSYPGASLESTSKAFIKTSTQTSATLSVELPSSPSKPSTNQSHDSKMDINVGTTVAVVVILLAILAFFILQNRKFKQRLLQLREGPSGQEEIRTAVRKDNEHPSGELHLTLHELAQQNTPRHELFGNEIHELSENEIHELYHSGIPEHDLVGDGSQEWSPL